MLRFVALSLALAACRTPEAPVPDAGPVICTPGATQCGHLNFKSQTADRCNDAGTEWVVVQKCFTQCANGACRTFDNTPY